MIKTPTQYKCDSDCDYPAPRLMICRKAPTAWRPTALPCLLTGPDHLPPEATGPSLRSSDLTPGALNHQPSPRTTSTKASSSSRGEEVRSVWLVIRNVSMLI